MLVRICWTYTVEGNQKSGLRSDERFKVLGPYTCDHDANPYGRHIDKEIVARKSLMDEIVKEHCGEFKEIEKYQIYEMTEEEFALLLLKI